MAAISGNPPRIEDVGPVYDAALGFQDPNNNGIVTMVGYVLTKNGQFQVSTDLQDEQHLVQIASPNQSDRYSRYPRVSFGDWTHGNGQLIAVDAQKYYIMQGCDPRTPGQLTLWTQPVGPFSSTDHSSFKKFPAASDGKSIAYALLNTNNLTITTMMQTTPNYSYNIASLSEITDIYALPKSVAGGQFLCAVPSQGIYMVTGGGPSPTTTLITSDNVPPTAMQTMAYFQGYIYYIVGNPLANGNAINRMPSAGPFGGAGSAVHTADAWENPIALIASTSSGLMFATSQVDTTLPCGHAILYTFDGSTATRVADFEGYVKYIHEFNGTTYILVEPGQAMVSPTGNALSPEIGHNFELYTFSNGVITLALDLRQGYADFQVNDAQTNIAYPSMADDGRYLYIAYPGLVDASGAPYILCFDPQNNAFFFRGVPSSPYNGTWPTPSALFTAARVVYVGGAGVDYGGTAGAYLFVEDSTAINRITQFSDNYALPIPHNGYVETSFVDAGVPTLIKSFDGLEIDMLSNPPGTSVSAEFRLDNQSSFVAAPIITTGNNQFIAANLPNTLGYRIQWRLTLSAGRSGGVVRVPILATMAVKLNLGRVWTVNFSCRHNQQVRSGVGSMNDPQGLDGVTLLRNILQAYQLSGYATFWVPDPASDLTDSTGNLLYVSIVQVYIEDIQVSVAPGVSPAFSNQVNDGSRDMSYDCQLTLVEVV